ncbi:AMMECR1 domain protein [Desulfotomaculum nigrificans CO-1-SRB]|uniref:AMMECR1 domain protein n=1 Tax=Desulfotomaculum nigrificans (strain DSM 14880 / VKM B-2319 / CO-1-SRB) TaxID=868595 RepID=F6B5T4_DESCC|nr:AmmeMemoRadiSam system protein A [Desulfotomaculum nigrificans]AEF93157.1 AMMECR1 domain protein [Desulfotomaculum nigrificans CO-1-SRB]
MSVVFGGIMPHPPIALPEVGGAEADKVMDSRQAMLDLGQRIKQSGAEILVLISPHAPVFGDGIAINISPQTRGNMGQFGAAQVSFTCRYDPKLGTEIGWQAEELGIPVIDLDEQIARQTGINLQLDHGMMVPLYFLRQAGVELPLVPCSMGIFSPEKLYSFGVAVQRAAEALGSKVAVVASGDLSHRLTPDAPAGFDPRGKEFDQKIVALIKSLDVTGLINLDEDLCERAGECGLRPIIMMLGALDGLAVKSEVLAYEGPFGVGYMVAALEPTGRDQTRRLLASLQQERKQKLAQLRAKESYLVRVARQSLTSYLEGHWKDPASYDVPEEFARGAGAFVSLKKNGHLRGCIGTTAPTRANVVQEVAYNAVSAGTEDPRFYPVRLDELDELTISVDVLMPPEPIDGVDQLDVKKYGVIVRRGARSGLLLPDLEGIDTPEQQVAVAKQKAGIGPDEPVQLERFEVVRYH